MGDLASEIPELQRWIDAAREVSGYLWQKGWAERNAGNLSVDVTEMLADRDVEPGERVGLDNSYPDLGGRFFLVTGTGRRYRDLAKDPECNCCILRMTDDGAAYDMVWGGEGSECFRPTSEFPSHLRIHEHLRLSEAPQRVVLHTHPTELIALTHLPQYREESELNRALFCTHPEVKVTLPAGVGLVPYTVPGTEEIAISTVEVFRRGRPLAIWQWHGCVAIGRDVMEAFDLIDTLNKSAKVLLLCHAAGHAPQGLSKQQLGDLARAFKLRE